jgi:hypothetical protein
MFQVLDERTEYQKSKRPIIITRLIVREKKQNFYESTKEVLKGYLIHTYPVKQGNGFVYETEIQKKSEESQSSVDYRDELFLKKGKSSLEDFVKALDVHFKAVKKFRSGVQPSHKRQQKEGNYLK